MLGWYLTPFQVVRTISENSEIYIIFGTTLQGLWWTRPLVVQKLVSPIICLTSLPASLADNSRSRAGSVYNSNNTDYMTTEAGLVLAVMLHGCWCRRWVTRSCCNPSECMHGVHAGLHCSQWLPECHWIKCSCMATLDKHDVGQQATVQTDHWRSASWIVPESELVLMQLPGRPQVSTAVCHRRAFNSPRDSGLQVVSTGDFCICVIFLFVTQLWLYACSEHLSP